MTQSLLSMTTRSRDIAYRLSGTMTELIEPTPSAVSVYEADGGWQVDAYFDLEPDDLRLIAANVVTTSEVQPETTEFGLVPDVNWVAISQAALPPVHAGRFLIHGSHDRSRSPRGPWSIEIDAGEAFGTAHHATTYGCLQAISKLTLTQQIPARVLDLGTGSGVLAIAVARRFPGARIIASDVDKDSVTVARANVARNRAASNVKCIYADGIPSQIVDGSCNLVIANILAGPLVGLAGSIARATRSGGTVVLSGILSPQAAAVLAAYRAHGFITKSHVRIEGWSTLILQKRSGRAVAPEPINHCG